ncbi:uncharacterized protein MONBRDRAFT_17767 [Monosiga brevicollis MX1]|uniref:Glutamate/phenylalanine/leucine/valine/L-tryptophan dehydrogenase C-terminal domain-containing protein n=1 Tax=Monosiga brevicollis TaxID=81824 RepID=A9URB8_MONBE|nr:uncharacterized protein MONBRDRAFT_17767 [Monosiga brevicollis MX1]EDQ91898.1 predicted protein [Monosiga brevicollis MX1]|eukprot:XP_001743184.1 hypothetical protein [Monosiga brevicollis MX1]
MSEKPVSSEIWRLQAFRSKRPVDPKSKVHLRLYFLQAPVFETTDVDENERDIRKLADTNFLKQCDADSLERYQEVMNQVMDNHGYAIKSYSDVIDSEGEKSTLVMVAHLRDDGAGFFVGVPNVYRFHNLFASSKAVETFANGVVVYSFYLRPLTAIIDDGERSHSPVNSFETRVKCMLRDISLHYVLPSHSLTPLLSSSVLSAEEVAYAFCAWKFAFHFLNRGQAAHQQLSELLRHAGDSAASALSELRVAFQTHAFNEGSIQEAIFAQKDLVKHLYADFARRHRPSSLEADEQQSTGSRTTSLGLDQDQAAELAHIKRTCHTDLEQAVFTAFLSFNTHILKTNFYRPSKTALAFRLNPDFLSGTVYTQRPFGIFMVIGAEFRGFHIRFRDVARGGIRLVQSRYPQAYSTNVSNLFDECFNLASTQQRKNKDLPEGGSKGVILLGLHHQTQGVTAFKKYIDALLDLMLPNEMTVQHYSQPELLFLGPDEGTADLMDWASLHAKKRGYPYWKGFTTGKSTNMGGIPHDLYGMTTRSVRAYVTGIQRKLSLEGTACTKVQTGGPDGDLGSNEIKLGNEKTVAIVDGSGVLFDPEGINLQELRRLACHKPRLPVSNFDISLLSAQGYRVLVDDTDVKLPSGQIIESGLQFRNNYHLLPDLHADFFVPCGGRPAAVNESNWKTFCYDQKDNLRFSYIVEGANLFFTQEARLQLEAAGVVVVKDASANKGGVTSSSLEVLAALALTDDEFKQHMCVEETEPQFYTDYVKDVQQHIQDNADMEFERLWMVKENSKKPLCQASDTLSQRIVKLKDDIECSDLFDDAQLRRFVMRQSIPQTLQKVVSVEELERRLPESYLKARFSAFIASRYVYLGEAKGATELGLYQYLNQLRQLANN